MMKFAKTAFAKTAAFHFLAILLSVTLTIGVLLAGLKIFDVYLLSHRRAGPADEDADEATMRTLDAYPFTGGHIQAFKTERKPLWSNYYDDFDVTSGEYGFFIDFRLEAPPPKQDNEIRIVLTGGSTALYNAANQTGPALVHRNRRRRGRRQTRSSSPGAPSVRTTLAKSRRGRRATATRQFRPTSPRTAR